MKLRLERENQAKREMEECSFRPNITDYKPKKKKAEAQVAFGTREHIAKQKVAREMKEAATVVPHCTGEKWTPGCTQPQEFSFAHEVKVNSLSAPMSPRVCEAEIERKKALVQGGYAERAMRNSSPSLRTTPRTSSPARHSCPRGGHYSSPQRGGRYGSPSASTEWTRRAGEKESAEEAHTAAGMPSPRYYASDVVPRASSPSANREKCGESTHLERMRKARTSSVQKSRAAASTTGENWSPGPTVPDEFKFIASKAVKIKSLHKPVSPLA